MFFGLRIYFQRYPATLDGEMERGELIAFASTPAGQNALENMLRSVASPEPPLLDRLKGMVHRHSPDSFQFSHPLETDARLLNAMRVLEKLPPELKSPHIPIFVEMLDHPFNAALALEELEKLGPAASNAIPLLLARMENQRIDTGTVQLAAKLAPGHPRIFAALASAITNGPALGLDRYVAVRQLAELYPTNNATQGVLQIATQDADPMLSSIAPAILILTRCEKQCRSEE